jgi:hypothetical protein
MQMFWLFLITGAMALFFMQFGAMSMTIKLMSFGLHSVLLIGAALGLVYLVRWMRRG